MDNENKCGTFTQCHITQLSKNIDFMKFAGTWIGLENIILSEVTRSQKKKKTHMVCTH